MLRALLLTDVDGRSGFNCIAADGSGGETGWQVVGTIDAGGTIDADGTIAVARRDPSSLGLGSDLNRLHQGGSTTIPALAGRSKRTPMGSTQAPR